MTFVSGRRESINGLFTTEEEDRAGQMFGRGVGRPIIPNRVNNLLYSFSAPFPPPPFAVEIFAGRAEAGFDPFSRKENTVGLAWDSATKMAAPPQLIRQDNKTTFRIDRVEGNRLEVWTDGLIAPDKGNEDNGLPWGFKTPVLRPLTSSVPVPGAKPPPPPSTLPNVAAPIAVPGVDAPDARGLSPTMIAAGVGVVAVAALLLLGSSED